MNWYVLHVLSGHENKVKNYIDAEAPLSDVAERIGRIVVPAEEKIEMRNGKKKVIIKKFLPSYVLIEMDLTKETQYFISNVPSVTSFVGPARRPERLKPSEVERILGQIDASKAREVPEMKYIPGDKVKVIDGPFSDFTGTVEEALQMITTKKLPIKGEFVVGIKAI